MQLCSGETEYNKQKIIQGQKDVALSDVGRQQAELVAERLSGEKFRLVFSSDLSRARKVAALPFPCMCFPTVSAAQAYNHPKMLNITHHC